MDVVHRGRLKASRAEDQRPIKQSEIVRSSLEDMIVSGKLAPGTRLDEETLADQFGVSRTPVREALLQLSTTGLVHARPRQSATVAELTVTDILQNFEFNLEIECICVRLAARRMTASERAALGSIVERMRPLLRRRDKERYVALNREFHHAIFLGSHNRAIENQARLLFSRLAPYRRLILLRPGQIEVSLRQHERILAAIEAGDAAAAEAAMRTHASLEDASFLDVIAMIERGSDG